jgi:hypothetical protein
MAWVFDAAMDFLDAGGGPLLWERGKLTRAQSLAYADDMAKLAESRGHLIDQKDALFLLSVLRGRGPLLGTLDRARIAQAVRQDILERVAKAELKVNSKSLSELDEWLGL